MIKYKFSNTERFIVWKSYGCKCFWCGEPLEHQQTSIDHLFPEKLLADKIEFNRIKLVYSLPTDFEINDFCNWVPAHISCNSKKASKLLKNSPAFLIIVEKVIKQSTAVKKSFQNLKKRILKDKVIMKLLADLENNNISDHDLLNLLESTSIYHLNMPELFDNEITHLPKGWKVLSIDRKVGKMRVVSGFSAGDIPIDKEPDKSWMCPTCYCYGPWNGNKCLSCGHHHHPNE